MGCRVKEGIGHHRLMFLEEPPSSDRAAALYQADRESDGYVNNLTRVWSWRPDFLAAFYDVRAVLLRDSELSSGDVALINAATASARGDSYCALAWGGKVATETDAGTAAQVLSGSSVGLDDRGAALVAWSRKVAVDPNSTTAQDVEALRAVGLGDRVIAEVTMLSAWRLAFSTVNDALGAQPDAQLAQGAAAEIRAAVRYGRSPSETPSS